MNRDKVIDWIIRVRFRVNSSKALFNELMGFATMSIFLKLYFDVGLEVIVLMTPVVITLLYYSGKYMQTRLRFQQKDITYSAMQNRVLMDIHKKR